MEITLLLTHGKIYTMDGGIYEAIAVSKDRIVKLGSNAELKDMGGPGTLKLDLKGKPVFPGFNVSHFHLQMYGANQNSVDLSGTGSIKDVIETTRRYMIRTGKLPGDWIIGRGWNQKDFIEESFPTRSDLDRVSNENPIVIIRTCCHIGVMNTAAMKFVGADNDTSVPGGVFDKDRNGSLNGVFRENAIGWVFDRIPLNPMYGIYAAVTGKSADGEPGNGSRPEEKMTVYQALELYTRGAAYDSFEENEKGILREGKLADMAILSEDPLEADPESIKDIEVLTTILGGEIIYTKG